MSYNNVWDNEAKSCYRVELRDNWTWEEFREAHTRAYEYLGGLGYDVDFIVAFYSALPEGSAIPHLTFAGNQPKNVRHTVMLNATDMATTLFVQTIVGTVATVKKWDGPKFVSTLQEARDYLATKNNDS